MHRSVIRPSAALSALALALALLLLLAPAPARADTFRLATLDYPPYSVARRGAVTGIAAETVRAAFARLGHEARIELLPWAEALDQAKNGEIDGVFTIFRTPEREAFLDFSREVLADQVMVLLARAGSGLEIESLSAVAGKNIGVVRGLSYGPVFDQAARTGALPRITAFASGEENLKALLAGRVDLAVSNRYGAMDILTRLGRAADTEELSPPLETAPSYLAFSRRKNLAALRDAVDATLAKMRRDGTLQTILEAWFVASASGPQNPPAPKADQRPQRKKPQ
jgi:polar amino acid transport system substrate-binding protein